MGATRTTRRAVLAGAGLATLPAPAMATTADSQFLAWEREAAFWNACACDGMPKTDADLDVIMDRAGYFEGLIMTTPGTGATVARIRATVMLREAREFGPRRLVAQLEAVVAALQAGGAA